MPKKIKINSDLKKFLLFLTLFIAFEMILFNSGNPIGKFIMRDIPSSITFPDLMQQGYSNEEINTFLIDLGVRGRQTYFRNLILVDILLPVTYALFYLYLFKFLISKITKSNKIKYFFMALPVVAAILDYTENIGMLVLTKQFPKINNSLKQFSSIVTEAKWKILNICFFASLILLFIYICQIIIRQIKSKS